jgi:hypothetical protein
MASDSQEDPAYTLVGCDRDPSIYSTGRKSQRNWRHDRRACCSDAIDFNHSPLHLGPSLLDRGPQPSKITGRNLKRGIL